VASVCQGGAAAWGADQLFGADITSQLSCVGARLTGADGDGNALVADGMKTGADVFLDEVFTSAGAVRLSRVDIIGSLGCRGAESAGADGDGNDLVVDGMRAGGAVYLDRGFSAAGAVRLSGADIAESLSCSGAHLAGTYGNGNALVAEGMKAGGSVILDEFTAADGVVLRSARIDGSLSLQSAKLAGDENKVALDTTGLQQRLEWLGSQPKQPRTAGRARFATQPYEQLAAVYWRAGQDTEARKVAIARRRDLRRCGDLTRSRKAVHWLLDVTIRYGYET
jgi:hypothetical protein